MITVPTNSTEDWGDCYTVPWGGLWVFGSLILRSFRIVRSSTVVETALTMTSGQHTMMLLLQSGDTLQVEPGAAFDLYGVRIGDEL